MEYIFVICSDGGATCAALLNNASPSRATAGQSQRRPSLVGGCPANHARAAASRDEMRGRQTDGQPRGAKPAFVNCIRIAVRIAVRGQMAQMAWIDMIPAGRCSGPVWSERREAGCGVEMGVYCQVMQRPSVVQLRSLSVFSASSSSQSTREEIVTSVVHFSPRNNLLQ